MGNQKIAKIGSVPGYIAVILLLGIGAFGSIFRKQPKKATAGASWKVKKCSCGYEIWTEGHVNPGMCPICKFGAI